MKRFKLNHVFVTGLNFFRMQFFEWLESFGSVTNVETKIFKPNPKAIKKKPTKSPTKGEGHSLHKLIETQWFLYGIENNKKHIKFLLYGDNIHCTWILAWKIIILGVSSENFPSHLLTFIILSHSCYFADRIIIIIII